MSGLTVRLRDVQESDLPILFEHQADPDSNRMAAFPARDRAAFDAHWKKILANEAVVKQTILFGDEVAGNIVSFEQGGGRHVGYWIGRTLWGKGIATAALAAFLGKERTRPLFACVVAHNAGSLRVLEKCGFVVLGRERHFDARFGEEIEEVALRLDADAGT